MLNKTLLKKLDSFQCEIGKRILQLYQSPLLTTLFIIMAHFWPSIRACVLCIKLSFLLKVMRDEDSLSSQVFRSLAADDVESLVLVKQCQFLEAEYGSSFTSDIISNVNNISYTRIKKVILEKDISLLFHDSESHPSQHLIHCIATSPKCSWPKNCFWYILHPGFA